MTQAQPDRLKQLEEVQQWAIEHAVDEMTAAHALTLETKEERGDRSWLTGMAAKSLGVAVRIEQFLELRRTGKSLPDDDEAEKAAKDRMLSRARTEVGKLLERAGVKTG